MKLFRFRLGFLLGYLVAVIRRGDENDPMIRRLKAAEQGIKDLAARVRGRPENHPIRRGIDRARRTAS